MEFVVLAGMAIAVYAFSDWLAKALMGKRTVGPGGYANKPGWRDDSPFPISKQKNWKPVLCALYERGPLDMSELEETTGINSPHIYAVLQEFREKGEDDYEKGNATQQYIIATWANVEGGRRLFHLSDEGKRVVAAQYYGIELPPAPAQRPRPAPSQQSQKTERPPASMPQKPNQRPPVAPQPMPPAAPRPQPAPTMASGNSSIMEDYAGDCLVFGRGKSVKLATISEHFQRYANLQGRAAGNTSVVSFLNRRGDFDKHNIEISGSGRDAELHNVSIRQDGLSGKILASLKTVTHS